MDWWKYGLKILENIHIHKTVEKLPSVELVEMLPGIHALTGCDTASKVGTKKKTINAMMKEEHQQLRNFGICDLDKEMVTAAEKFLIDCMPKSYSADSFNSLRYLSYHSINFKLNIEKFPCTSSNLRLHIQRAYLQ